MLAVLLGALLHAGWNALIRGSADRTLDTVLISTGAAVVAACALLFLPLPLPAPESWPYLAVSGVIHVAYFLLVASSYRHGELSFAYPLMRGSAPALSAIAAAVLLTEIPTAGGWLGVLLISGGVLMLAGDSWRTQTFHGHTALFALSTAGVIAIYTLVDGVGVRLSGHAVSYTCWIQVLTAIPLLGIFLARNSAATGTYLRHHWRRGLIGGGSSLASYALALWAMTQAPIAMVAALRETSVVFAAIIAATLLGERVSRMRYLAIFIVAAGAVAIKLA